MPNIIAESYSSYMNFSTKFDEFHNNVINMPRPTFTEIPDIVKLFKSLSEYILLIDKDILAEEMQAVDVYREIFNNYKKGVVPTQNRNITFENTFLNSSKSFKDLYSSIGRRFRHYTELLSFFDIFVSVRNKFNRFDLDSLEELRLTPEENIFDMLRNKLLDLNIRNNSHINSLEGIKVEKDADYRPARAILRYLSAINRRATDFEIAVLFGRVDDVQKENDILLRATKISSILPPTRTEQIKIFFGSMGWKNSKNELFKYGQSQEPYFKFKTFLILMDTFNLIVYRNNVIELAQYGKELVKSDIPIEVLDLENLLSLIDDDNEDSNKLQDIILRKRTETITNAIQTDGTLVEKLNLRNIRKPIIKNNKRIRSRLIMELAKIKANYMDEVSAKPTFEGKNGLNYVEAHHIIEFKGENGPDITDNLICLGPENHMRIHRGSEATVADFYNTCKTRGVINFERFKNICIKYRCLTLEHVKTLLAKDLISKVDAEELTELIETNGVDEIFLQTLNIPTENN